MPKLSSAETPPEKSSDCLPVSTMALSGVMTRMPLVCMSIVASAFQYGWAPTLMPATTMLISPPAWVNSMIRLSARATQSMFSVPESIEIRAPADRANHSTGTCICSARSSAAMIARALGLGDRAEGSAAGRRRARTRVTPSGCSAVGVVTTAAMMPALLRPYGPVDRDERPGVVEVVLDDRAAVAGDHRLQLVGVDQAAAAGADDLLGVVVERLEPLGRRLPRRRRRRRSRAGSGTGREMGDGAVVGAGDAALDQDLLDAGAGRQRRDLVLQGGELVEVGLDRSARSCTQTWFMSSRAPGAPRPTATRRIASRQLAMARSTCGSAGDLALLVADDDELAHLGERDEAVVGGVVRGDAVVEQHVLGRLEPGHVEVAQPPQVEAASDHRVHAADQPVLDERRRRSAGR